jgi:hypothetical protein
LIVAVGVTGCAAVPDYPYMTEGQPHAEAIVAAVAQEWKADALLKSADPRMLEAFPEPKIKELVATCSRELGAPKEQRTLVTSTGIGVGAPTGKFASYIIELKCEKGTATVTINIQKVKDDWRVLAFWVNVQGQPRAALSPAAVP